MNYRKTFNRITLIAWSNIAVIFLMCSITLNNAQAKILFKARIDYDAGDGPRAVAIDDLNGDAKPDLAVADWGSDSVSILINTGGYGDELAIDFGAFGLWNFNIAGTWSPISSDNAEGLSGWANGLAMDFGSLGLWNFDTAWMWEKISGGDVGALTAVDLY